MALPYRLATTEVQSGYLYVNGRPHGFKFDKRYAVTFHFGTKEERADFIRWVKAKKPPENQGGSS